MVSPSARDKIDVSQRNCGGLYEAIMSRGNGALGDALSILNGDDNIIKQHRTPAFVSDSQHVCQGADSHPSVLRILSLTKSHTEIC